MARKDTPPQTVSLPIEGGCQCGALRYLVATPPLMIYACHCTNCQRIAGSAFGLSATITEDSLRFTSGTPRRVRWRSNAGNERYGTFCGNCGCRIAHGQEPSNGVLSLRAGTFDDPSWVVPTGHIWTKSAQPWFPFDTEDILWPGQPTDYLPIIEKFRSRFSFEVA